MDSQVATVLGDVLERLHRTPDRRDLLRVLADAVQEMLPCESSMVWLQSARYRTLKARFAAPSPLSPDLAATLQLDLHVLEKRSGLTQGRCLRLTDDPGACADLALIRKAMGARTTDEVLVIPFVHRDRIEALVSCLLPDGASAEQVATWEQVAPHVATVLHGARLHDTSTTMRAYRTHFATLGAEVLTARDVETTAVRLCELTRALFGTTRSALFVLEGEDLVPLAAAGPYGDRATGGALHVPPGVEPGFDEALRTGQVLVINEFRSSPYAGTPIPLPFRPQAAMVMPLVDGTGKLGVLTASELEDPHRFGPDAAERGRLLAVVATVAVRRMLLLEELQRASRTKDEFLATVSHELRTPINVVLGYVQLLTEQTFGPMSAEQTDTIRRVEKGARSLLGLVDDLLDLARIERGAVTCEFEEVRVAEILDDLGDATLALVGNRPIRFSCEVRDDPVAWTDRERLKQVLLNVVGNAAKFTTRGSIELRSYVDGDRVVLEVADTGSGMEPGFVGRATEPFVRGENSSGSGLGLAIVARVLRVLNGSLAIDSKPGTGTTVRILLPTAAAASLDLSTGC